MVDYGGNPPFSLIHYLWSGMEDEIGSKFEYEWVNVLQILFITINVFAGV